jgi:RNA polymerase sigma-54 factor
LRGLDGGLGLDGVATGGGEGADYDAFAGEDVSLHEHLLAQAGSSLNERDLMIARQIIEQIDETGYLLGSLLEVAHRLGAPLHEVERVLGIIHGFDPPGVAARSLAECLALQAREADRYDPAMARLIDKSRLPRQGQPRALRRILRRSTRKIWAT